MLIYQMSSGDQPYLTNQCQKIDPVLGKLISDLRIAEQSKQIDSVDRHDT